VRGVEKVSKNRCRAESRRSVLHSEMSYGKARGYRNARGVRRRGRVEENVRLEDGAEDGCEARPVAFRMTRARQ